jgi:hypothetical protein
MRLQIEGADILRHVFESALHHPEFALSRPRQFGAITGSLGTPDQEVGLRREGGEPSTIYLSLAKGVADFCEQRDAGLQQHGPDDEQPAELQNHGHYKLPLRLAESLRRKTSPSGIRFDGKAMSEVPTTKDITTG